MNDKLDFNALAAHMNTLAGDPLRGVNWQDCAAGIIVLISQRDALLAAAKAVTTADRLRRGLPSAIEDLRIAIRSCGGGV